MDKLLKITCGCLLLFGVSAMTLSAAGCSKESSSDMKQAGREVGKAAKDTGNAVKSEIHKGAKKTAEATK